MPKQIFLQFDSFFLNESFIVLISLGKDELQTKTSRKISFKERLIGYDIFGSQY